MTEQNLQIVCLVSLPFEENSYVVHRTGRTDAVVVDPGLEPEKIVACLEEAAVEPVAILCTHGHSDHIAGNRTLKTRWPQCQIVIGHGDVAKLTDPELNLSAAFGVGLTSPPADGLVREGETYQAAGCNFEVLEVPGHSPGHVAFLLRAISPFRLFGGDVLFQGSVGRTDFPDGDFQLLESSIRKKFFPLPDDTIVLSGHGPPTTIGTEKRSNPFVGELTC